MKWGLEMGCSWGFEKVCLLLGVRCDGSFERKEMVVEVMD